MKYLVKIEDEELEVVIEGRRVLVGGEEVEAGLLSATGAPFPALRLGNRTHTLVVGAEKDGTRVLHVDGRPFRVSVENERTRRIREMSGAAAGLAGPRPLKAPMPGLVVKVEVEEGQAVVPGQGLVIVEAMKMENELKAEAEGVVSHILVKEGQPVEKDQVLLDFQAPDGEDE